MRTDDPVVVGSALRISYFVIFLGYSLCTYVMARQFLRPLFALAAALAPTLSMQSLHLSNLLFAEIPFGLLSVAFVIFSHKKGRRIYPVLAGVFAVMLYLIRSVGLAVLGAWVAASLLKRRWRQAAVRGAVAVIPVMLWL